MAQSQERYSIHHQGRKNGYLNKSTPTTMFKKLMILLSAMILASFSLSVDARSSNTLNSNKLTVHRSSDAVDSLLTEEARGNRL